MQTERFTQLIQNNQLLNEETLPGLKAVTEEFPWFQTGWMLYLKNLLLLDSNEFEPVLKKVAALVSNRELLYNFLHSNKVVVETSEESNELDEKQELIEQFLKTGPAKIKVKPAGEGESPEELNKSIIQKSTLEDNELITETLAQIYFDQKDYSKALEAYEKLSLKYPEKSVYFASRIKEIEKIKEK